MHYYKWNFWLQKYQNKNFKVLVEIPLQVIFSILFYSLEKCSRVNLPSHNTSIISHFWLHHIVKVLFFLLTVEVAAVMDNVKRKIMVRKIKKYNWIKKTKLLFSSQKKIKRHDQSQENKSNVVLKLKCVHLHKENKKKS